MSIVSEVTVFISTIFSLVNSTRRIVLQMCLETIDVDAQHLILIVFSFLCAYGRYFECPAKSQAWSIIRSYPFSRCPQSLGPNHSDSSIKHLQTTPSQQSKPCHFHMPRVIIQKDWVNALVWSGLVDQNSSKKQNPDPCSGLSTYCTTLTLQEPYLWKKVAVHTSAMGPTPTPPFLCGHSAGASCQLQIERQPSLTSNPWFAFKLQVF